jgi:Kelch motif
MAGTWTPLTNQPPIPASTMLLLTDGTVLAQESGGKRWLRLSPDQHGSYINGAWSPQSSMANTRLYYASAVLDDGRVFVAGGEYSDAGGDTNKAELFNPVLDQWSPLPPPPGWNNIGDAPCTVLPDGRLLLGSIFDQRTAIYDPGTNAWTAGPNKDDPSSEETWTLLPDETVLSAECSQHPKTEKYVAAANQWVSAGNTPVDLVQASSIEIGPALLLPDGRVFATGASGHTAIYTPPNIANQPGTWTAGPDFPLDANGKLMEAKDAPGCLMPNGSVLCAAGPAGEGGSFPGPTQFFEFDGASLNSVPNPPNNGGPPFVGRMLLIPSGQVLFADGSNQVYAYTPSGGPDPAWAPHITSCPHRIEAGHSYTLHGRQLNGLSQAVSYGDDATAATNYPLVRIRHAASGKVYFCRTFNHSSMGVATGTSIQHTTFKVPFGAPHGASQLVVIANGIPSNAWTVNVKPFHFWNFPNFEAFQQLIGSLADGPLWVLGPHGPVPVDPWGPKVAKRAEQAYSEIRSGIRALYELGNEVISLREKESVGVRLPQIKSAGGLLKKAAKA